MKETALVKSILMEAGYSKEVTLWRNNTGGVHYEGKNGKTRFVKFGVKGASDIFGIRKKDGKFIAIECKVGKNKLTVFQEYFGAMVEENNGIFVVARCVDDWKQVLIKE